MRTYTITCESGTVALVRARSADDAEREWDDAVRRRAADRWHDGASDAGGHCHVRPRRARLSMTDERLALARDYR